MNKYLRVLVLSASLALLASPVFGSGPGGGNPDPPGGSAPSASTNSGSSTSTTTSSVVQTILNYLGL